MRGFIRRGTWIGFLVVLASAVWVAPASASYKPFSVVMSGDVASTGTVALATITNETKTQQLGSANLTVPSGYTVSGTPSTSQGAVSLASDATGPAVVQLRNASLAPGTSLTISIPLSVASPCPPGTWSIAAKQSNDFSGPPGNELNLDAANSVLTTTLCAATFTGGTANTTANLPGGKADVTATTAAATQGKSLFESGNLANVSPVDCSSAARGGYLTADPNTYGVITTAAASKVVTITISNPTIPLVGSANQILKNQQICFDAPYTFTTFAGIPDDRDGAGGYIGLLQTCTGSTIGPCHNRQADSVITDPVTGNVTGVVLVADIPSGLQDDPHMG
jgi:hypothetical protein